MNWCVAEADWGECGSDSFDLPVERIDELGLVSVVHVEPHVHGEPAADIAPFDLAAVVLRIDDPDAVRGDDEVIDVASCVRDHAIMEYDGNVRRTAVDDRLGQRC